AITNMSASFGAGVASKFIIGTVLPNALEAGVLSAQVNIRPKVNLPAGTYTDTVTFTADGGMSHSFDVSVTVNAAPTYMISEIADQAATTLTQDYVSGTQETVTINVYNNGTGNLSNLTATVTGTNFVISLPSETLDSGTATNFTVKVKDGLAAGTYTATVKISADLMTDVTFTITQVVNSPDEPSQPTTPSTPEPTHTSVDVLVNGKVENMGTATVTKVNDQTVTTVSIDPKKLEDKLATEAQGAVVTIPVNTKSDVVIGELNGQMVKNMENKQAVLEIKTDQATYTLPALQININAISDQIGKSIALQDIKVQIEIAAPLPDTVKIVENAAEKGMFSLVVPPVNFTVRAMYEGTTVEISKFNAYVERTIAIPDGIDPNKITTGVVVDPDGTVRHVPTKVVLLDGKYYAVINSLTNSTHSVVWHPLEFSDVANHWAKDAVNDMASRMVIEGTGNGMFSPERDITRAEFAAIIVRGLGLKLENGASDFSDVKVADWYSSAINTAYSYQLINGFEDGTFRPNDKITREQAMVIIDKAMMITNLKAMVAVTTDSTLSQFVDADGVSTWAQSSIAANVQSGIVSGRSGAKLAPKAHMTRAEVAAIVDRLLQKSGLI
ncbi:MAG: cell wall/surface repeat protein, partial [Paenibacillus sp.]|nr:cell wall/surface repeat protein [Paenibacillus sp.]